MRKKKKKKKKKKKLLRAKIISAETVSRYYGS